MTDSITPSIALNPKRTSPPSNAGPADVAAVGCVHKTPGEASFLQKVFGAVMSSYLGGFGTSQIQPAKEQFVESLSFCAFRKKALLKVGLNDPKFTVGQDAELNVRIRKAGYKFLYTPKTFVWYYKRPSYSRFFVQMFRYGWARAKIMKKHPDTAKIIYMGPTVIAAFTSSLIVGAILNQLYFRFSLLLILASALIALRFFSKEPFPSFKFLFAEYLALWVLYFGYGLGFIYGAIKA